MQGIKKKIPQDQVALVVKNLPANAGAMRDVGLIPGSERFPGGGHGSSLQYSCLETPIDKGAWWAMEPCKELIMSDGGKD